MKRTVPLAWALCALLLSGCAETAPQPPESPPPQELFSQGETAAGDGDVFYPLRGSDPLRPTPTYTWLEQGTVLAVPDQNTIRYVGLDNRLISEVSISPGKLLGDYHLIPFDGRTLVVNGQNGAILDFSACLADDGEWTLANGSIWDDRGELIREFPHLAQVPPQAGSSGPSQLTLSDGRTVENWEDTGTLNHLESHWINGDLLVLHNQSRLFFYRISTDTLTLADDMTQWMAPYGKQQVYLGIQYAIPAGEGCYYFADKNPEVLNIFGTVWYADESGCRVLFGGREFSTCFGEDGLLLLLRWAEDPKTHDTVSTHAWYADGAGPMLHDLGELEGFYGLQNFSGGMMTLRRYGYEAPTEFLVIDPQTGQIASHQPQCEASCQYDLLTARRVGGSLQYIYTTLFQEETQSYLYDTATDVTQPLDIRPDLPRDKGLYAPATHYVEPAPNMWDVQSVRVRPLP